MKNRREFLQHSLALALAGITLPQLTRGESRLNLKAGQSIGLQLYTLGDLMVNDAKGTLQKLAAIGYKELESAGSPKGNYYGFTPVELSKMIKDLGMTWRATHVSGAAFSMERMMKNAKTAADSARLQKLGERMKNAAPMLNLENDRQQLADNAAASGVSYLVCSSIPVSTLDEIKHAVEVFNKTGEACKKNKVEFAYHNHATEFDTVEGHRPFDYILNNTDKNLVKMELDLGWATKAKQDPVELFKQHSGRFPLWHVKDMDQAMSPTEVGTGTVDFKRIFAAAKDSGMKYFFVEQDQAPKPMENVANAYAFLSGMLNK